MRYEAIRCCKFHVLYCVTKNLNFYFYLILYYCLHFVLIFVYNIFKFFKIELK